MEVVQDTPVLAAHLEIVAPATASVATPLITAIARKAVKLLPEYVTHLTSVSTALVEPKAERPVQVVILEHAVHLVAFVEQVRNSAARVAKLRMANVTPSIFLPTLVLVAHPREATLVLVDTLMESAVLQVVFGKNVSYSENIC